MVDGAVLTTALVKGFFLLDRSRALGSDLERVGEIEVIKPDLKGIERLYDGRSQISAEAAHYQGLGSVQVFCQALSLL